MRWENAEMNLICLTAASQSRACLVYGANWLVVKGNVAPGPLENRVFEEIADALNLKESLF